MTEYQYPQKYQELIDKQTWGFIERTNGWYPPEAVELSVDEHRAIYNMMCQDFNAGRSEGVIVSDEMIEAEDRNIGVRTYRVKGADPIAWVLYTHGGGYILGSLESHDDVCAEICERTGFGVLSIDYRLSPEHKHPDAFDDVLAGFAWLAGKTELPIVLAGDSAGACLVAAVSHATRGQKRRPVGQVLIYPTLGGDHSSGSYLEHAEAPLLDIKSVVYYTDIRKADVDLSSDSTHAPLVDTVYSDLPPTVIISAECDPLADDGRVYRDRIVTAGGKACWFNEPGLVHGYLRARHSVLRAQNSFTRIIESILELGQNEWKY